MKKRCRLKVSIQRIQMKIILVILLIISQTKAFHLEIFSVQKTRPIVTSIRHGSEANPYPIPYIFKTYDFGSNEPKYTTSRTSLQLSTTTATWVGTSILGGLVGVPAVSGATRTWYRKINLPTWLPPDRIFGPVWTTLYALIGYTFSKVYQIQNRSNTLYISFPLKLALSHYALNIAWPFVFFGMKKLRAGYIINLILLASLIAILPLFYQIYPASVALLFPYLCWLIFATKLNETICKLNPTGSEKGYNNAMLQADICKLQAEAGRKAGL